MFIQVTEKDRRLYTKEYVASLEKSSRRYSKHRWFGMLIGLMNFMLGIFALIGKKENLVLSLLSKTGGITLVISSPVLFFLSLTQKNDPKLKYEKAKAIREILNTEEAEMEAKKCSREINITKEGG